MKRGWLWLLIGLAAGVGLGLIAGWVIWPVQYYNTAPADLRADYQREYIHIVTATYATDHDLESARARLTCLDATAPTAPLIALTEQLIAQAVAPTLITPLAQLAHDLDAATPAMLPYLENNLP